MTSFHWPSASARAFVFHRKSACSLLILVLSPPLSLISCPPDSLHVLLLYSVSSSSSLYSSLSLSFFTLSFFVVEYFSSFFSLIVSLLSPPPHLLPPLPLPPAFLPFMGFLRKANISFSLELYEISARKEEREGGRRAEISIQLEWWFSRRKKNRSVCMCVLAPIESRNSGSLFLRLSVFGKKAESYIWKRELVNKKKS